MTTPTSQLSADTRPSPNGEQRFLVDTPTLALRLGVTQRFVRRLIAEERVPYLKIGKFVRFDPDEITRWLDEKRVSVA